MDDPLPNREPWTTEQVDPRHADLDRLSALDLVTRMNQEDERVVAAVRAVLPQVAQAVDGIVARMRAGGRLWYVGAGTSGRLGILDASECPPTFGTDPGLVVGLIAGGPDAVTRSREGAEDDEAAAVRDLEAAGFRGDDALVGITASGTTPYTRAAVRHARQCGAFTVGFCCNAGAPLTGEAEVALVPVPGPEILAGSTRLKAGTATKMVLNMLSTATMVQLGRTQGNLMSHVRPGSHKLQERAARILQAQTGRTPASARSLLARAGGDMERARRLDQEEAAEGVCHIVPAADWRRSLERGRHEAPSLAEEGFLHCSTLAQVPATLRRHFRGQEDLLVLRLDPRRLTAELRWEDTSGHGVFPHLHGPLNLDAVQGERSVQVDPDGAVHGWD